MSLLIIVINYFINFFYKKFINFNNVILVMMWHLNIICILIVIQNLLNFLQKIDENDQNAMVKIERVNSHD